MKLAHISTGALAVVLSFFSLTELEAQPSRVIERPTNPMSVKADLHMQKLERKEQRAKELEKERKKEDKLSEHRENKMMLKGEKKERKNYQKGREKQAGQRSVLPDDRSFRDKNKALSKD